MNGRYYHNQIAFDLSKLIRLNTNVMMHLSTFNGVIIILNDYSKTKYLKKILKKYRMEDSKPVCTPMITICGLSFDDKFPTLNQLEYKYMIGNLLYLTGTILDIMHAVGILGRFQLNPKELHI